MSEFDRQNEDVFSLVRENRRRSDLAPVIGYIVPMKQAQSYAAYEEAQARNREGLAGVLLLSASLLALAAAAVMLLI